MFPASLRWSLLRHVVNAFVARVTSTFASGIGTFFPFGTFTNPLAVTGGACHEVTVSGP